MGHVHPFSMANYETMQGKTPHGVGETCFFEPTTRPRDRKRLSKCAAARAGEF